MNDGNLEFRFKFPIEGLEKASQLKVEIMVSDDSDASNPIKLASGMIGSPLEDFVRFNPAKFTLVRLESLK